MAAGRRASELAKTVGTGTGVPPQSRPVQSVQQPPKLRCSPLPTLAALTWLEGGDQEEQGKGGEGAWRRHGRSGGCARKERELGRAGPWRGLVGVPPRQLGSIVQNWRRRVSKHATHASLRAGSLGDTGVLLSWHAVLVGLRDD